MDTAKLLGSPAPVSWGALLGNLPHTTAQNLLAKARGDPPLPQPTKEAEEVAAMEAAVLALLTPTLPHNMFAPFSLATKDAAGMLRGQESAWLHWGNMDTGSMDLVYQGVLEAFPEL